MEHVLADPLYGFNKERPKVEPGTLLGLRALLLEEDKVCRLVVVPAPLEELLGAREVVAVRGVPAERRKEEGCMYTPLLVIAEVVASYLQTDRGERAAMAWSEGGMER
jgi:hypothetical protein